jgi:hypothetical protein
MNCLARFDPIRFWLRKPNYDYNLTSLANLQRHARSGKGGKSQKKCDQNHTCDFNS